jgi:hypothetical protein
MRFPLQKNEHFVSYPQKPFYQQSKNKILKIYTKNPQFIKKPKQI